MVGYVITPMSIGKYPVTPLRIQKRNRPSGMKCGEGGRLQKRNRLEGQVKI